jgi:uncharacterized ubiquitin-like protein YukD
MHGQRLWRCLKTSQINVEKLRIELEAKLSILKELEAVLHERIGVLEKALGDIENRGSKTSIAPTKRQIDYALDLARQTGFKVSEYELRNMSFKEVSKLIDQLIEKKKAGRKNG